MKRLYLLRHAKSTRDYRELSDFERPLSIRGRIDAPAMGRLLLSQRVIPDLILSSPASRAITTARMVAEVLGYPLKNILIEEEIYEAWVENLFSVIKRLPEEKNSVLLVGHNPGLQILAGQLASFPYEYLPTCGIVGMDIDVNSWAEIKPDSGKINFFEFPKKVRTS